MKSSPKVALYCDRPPRGGIGNYSRELHRNITDLDVTLYFVSEKDDRVECEGRVYPTLPKGKIADAEIHHGTDASLSHIVPKTEKSIITLHDIDEEGRIELTGIIDKPFLEPENVEYLKQAERIILDSYDARKRAVTKAGIPLHKTEVVHLGTDLNLFKPYEDKDKLRRDLEYQLPILQKARGKRIIINISSEEPRKNMPNVFKAFSVVQKTIPDSVLIRIGYQGIEQKPENIALQRELGISDSVVYLNNVSREQIARLYNISDEFLFPSLREGFGLVITEAMHSGTVVVGGNATTLPEIVGDTGLLVDPLNPKELADASIEALTNDKLRKELSQKAIKRVEENFTWDKCAAKTESIYKKMLE